MLFAVDTPGQGPLSFGGLHYTEGRYFYGSCLLDYDTNDARESQFIRGDRHHLGAVLEGNCTVAMEVDYASILKSVIKNNLHSRKDGDVACGVPKIDVPFVQIFVIQATVGTQCSKKRVRDHLSGQACRQDGLQ